MTKTELLRNLREQTFRAYECKALDKGYLLKVLSDSELRSLSSEELSLMSESLRDLLRTQ